MLYQRSLEIERRLDDVVRLIRTGGYSTPMIAEQLGVSIPTVSRDVTALRERGHDIRSVRKNDSWHYVLLRAAPPTASRRALMEARQ
jgi:biotin operon repressor